MSWAFHLVTLGLTGFMWHSYASVAFFKKFNSKWKNSNNVALPYKTSGRSFNRCLKQGSTLWFPPPTQLPKGTGILSNCFEQYCSAELMLVVSMQKNLSLLNETFISRRYLFRAAKTFGALRRLSASSLSGSIPM